MLRFIDADKKIAAMKVYIYKDAFAITCFAEDARDADTVYRFANNNKAYSPFIEFVINKKRLVRYNELYSYRFCTIDNRKCILDVFGNTVASVFSANSLLVR